MRLTSGLVPPTAIAQWPRLAGAVVTVVVVEVVLVVSGLGVLMTIAVVLIIRVGARVDTIAVVKVVCPTVVAAPVDVVATGVVREEAAVLVLNIAAVVLSAVETVNRGLEARLAALASSVVPLLQCRHDRQVSRQVGTFTFPNRRLRVPLE